ncbi:MAG: hypothetical protein EOO61_09935 [Hymenobacter sp.]|nr:MAG: hypothetical protein EOO61_09935 [Hymenobacter sp.]
MMVLNGQFKVGLSADVFLPNSSDIPAYVVSFKSTNNICSTSETIPSLAQQSCLTTSEAKASASINGPVTSFQCGFLIGGPRNMTGAIFYSYYSTILCNIGGVQFRAIGGQGMLIGVYGNVTAGNVEDSPFGQILTVPTYKLTSYRQLY